jgi:hypothetical protein
MTVHQRVICDRCGQIVLTDRTALDVRCGPLLPQLEAIDLCTGCVDLLRS